MKRVFYVVCLMAGISLASVNVANAQDTKVKGACCSKAKTTTDIVKSDESTDKVSNVALTTEGTVKTDAAAKTGCCAGKMAEGKVCTGVCTHKTGAAVSETKTTNKAGTVAAVEDKK